MQVLSNLKSQKEIYIFSSLLNILVFSQKENIFFNSCGNVFVFWKTVSGQRIHTEIHLQLNSNKNKYRYTNYNKRLTIVESEKKVYRTFSFFMSEDLHDRNSIYYCNMTVFKSFVEQCTHMAEDRAQWQRTWLPCTRPLDSIPSTTK